MKDITSKHLTNFVKGSNGKLYTLAIAGLINGSGSNIISTINEYDILTNQYIQKASLSQPQVTSCNLISDNNGFIYGASQYNQGIFKYDCSNNTLTSIYYSSTKIIGDLLLFNNNLYGVEASSGGNDMDYIISLDLNTNTRIYLDTLRYSDGLGGFNSSFIEANNKFYLLNNNGILEFDPVNKTFNLVYSFPNTSVNPIASCKLLKSQNGNLCGFIMNGGQYGYGYCFEFNPVNYIFNIKSDYYPPKGCFKISSNMPSYEYGTRQFTEVCKGISGTISIATNTLCYGSNVVIHNQAVGANITYTWYKNGILTNNTTADLWLNNCNNLSAGTYYCSASNGCRVVNSNTLNVYYSSSIAPVIIVPSANICIGTRSLLNASGASTYTWNTGSTTASINITPTITTTYTVIGTDLNNCSNSQTVTVTVDNTCADVWPGDANSDGIADNLDVLELGLHYTQTGTARATTSNLWQSYYSTNWSGTITNGKNLNHSNCNGDGIINDDDTLAIFNNYSLTHAFKPEQTNTNPVLTIVSDQSAVAKGTWGSASINLGNVTTPISNINGIAFTVNYDNTLLETDSVWLEYPTSFINASNQNLNFRNQNFTNGKLFTATTHTINGNVNGYGKIATLHYKIKSTLATDNILNLSVSQANQSNASGAITPLTAGSATLMAIGASVGINELTDGNYLFISPNPANDILVIELNTTNDINATIEITNTLGQVVLSSTLKNNKEVLNITHLTNGVYFVKVLSINKQVGFKKIVVQR